MDGLKEPLDGSYKWWKKESHEAQNILKARSKPPDKWKIKGTKISTIVKGARSHRPKSETLKNLEQNLHLEMDNLMAKELVGTNPTNGDTVVDESTMF